MAGQLTIDTLKASSGVLASQNGMTGIAKAWVNFQGGSGNTAGTINQSFNVSSITVLGTGSYQVNFTTAMPNANYAYAMSMYRSNQANNANSTSTPSTTSIQIITMDVSFNAVNAVAATVVVFSS